MIKANRTWLGSVFFSWYSNFRLEKNFKRIVLNGNFTDSGTPILLIANHFSWWDGFIQHYLSNKVLNRKFHVMMLEEQLLQHMVLNKGGAFSIRKGSKNILESLQYCLELLQDPHNMVLIFPQGEIQSIYTRHFVFEKGLYYLLKHLQNDVQLVFNVNLIDYFSESAPSLSVYYKSYSMTRNMEVENIENDFNRYAGECMAKQKPI